MKQLLPSTGILFSFSHLVKVLCYANMEKAVLHGKLGGDRTLLAEAFEMQRTMEEQWNPCVIHAPHESHKPRKTHAPHKAHGTDSTKATLSTDSTKPLHALHPYHTIQSPLMCLCIDDCGWLVVSLF